MEKWSRGGINRMQRVSKLQREERQMRKWMWLLMHDLDGRAQSTQRQRDEELCQNGELQVVKKKPAKLLLSSHLSHQ